MYDNYIHIHITYIIHYTYMYIFDDIYIYTYDIHIYTYFKSNLMYIIETTNGRNFHFRHFFELIIELILNYFFIL